VTVNAVLLDDRRVVHHLDVADPASGVEHAHRALVVDELEQVAVTGHDVDVTVSSGQRADDVIGLEPGYAKARHPERGERGHDDRDLHLEVGRRVLAAVDGDPVGLVRRHRVHSESRAPVGVEAGHEAGRLVLADEVAEKVQHPAYGVDRRPVRRADRVRDAEVRPEVERGRVEEHQPAWCGVAHRRIMTAVRASRIAHRPTNRSEDNDAASRRGRSNLSGS